MALFKEWKTGQYGRAAIWKIEESDAIAGLTDIHLLQTSDEQSRAAYLVACAVLVQLDEDFPVDAIYSDEQGKLRTANNEYFFSIAHAWPYVAVMMDAHSETGIAILKLPENVEGLKQQYISAEEEGLFHNDKQLLTLACTAKEAVVKWCSLTNLNMTGDISIEQFYNVRDKYEMVIYLKPLKMPQMVFVENLIAADVACSWVYKAQDWAIY